MREPGGEGAERDEGLALAGVALDAAGGADQPAQQVHGEGEPRLAEAAQLRRAASRKTRLGAMTRADPM